MPPLIRIVDDNPGLLDSLSFLLRSEGYDIAAYSGADVFLKEDTPSRPGCLILDVCMPKISGLELQYILNTRRLWIPVIFLTAHGNVDMAVNAMHEGAFDFQQKPVSPPKLLSAVARAVRADLKRRGGSNDEAFAATVADKLRRLTQRERDVLRLTALGLTSHEIGDRLKISFRTAEHYRADGLKKINAKNTAELAQFFETSGN